MAPKFPDEVDVFAVPHTRMKALVDIYMDQMSKTDFCSNGALEMLLENLATTFYEFKTHEYIENQFIMERLKQRLKMVNASSQAVCNCHGDSRLVEIMKLLRDGYSCTGKSVAERLSYGIRLQKAVGEFTAKFLPHMQEEEDVFQPLLMKYFAYDELRSLKELVIEQHELWKQKLIVEKVGAEDLFTLLSSFATEVADYYSSDSDDEELREAVQTIVELTCENLVRQKSRKTVSFNSLPEEMIGEIFSYLNPLDRTRCARVCKLWNILIYAPELWREVYPTNWAKGLCDFQYHDPYPFAEADLKKRRCSAEDAEEEWLSPEAQREVRLYEQFVVFVLPRIGEGVQRLVVAGGRYLNSHMLRSMLILCPNLVHLDASYCANITDFSFKGLARTGSCSRLTFLDLSGCNQITDVGLQRLGDCFRLEAGTMDCKTCESCCKSCNLRPVICDADFTDEEELGFCDSSPGIGYLNLSGCLFVTDFGLQSLLEVSLHMNSLHFMDLSGCSRISGDALVSVASRSSKLQPKDLYYCNMIEGGPYPTEANGCQNLICPLRGCCCTGD